MVMVTVVVQVRLLVYIYSYAPLLLCRALILSLLYMITLSYTRIILQIQTQIQTQKLKLDGVDGEKRANHPPIPYSLLPQHTAQHPNNPYSNPMDEPSSPDACKIMLYIYTRYVLAIPIAKLMSLYYLLSSTYMGQLQTA